MLKVEVVSPERILYTGDASFVLARTIGGGEIAFLTGHTPFLGALDIGTVLVRDESGDELLVAVHGGFVEVSGDRVTILSDVAELADQIDTERARRALAAAESEAARRRAEVRIEVAEGAPAAARH